jgi:ferredoxin
VASDELRERVLAGLTVRIDRNTCIASKNCIGLAPDVFELDEENIVSFRSEAPDDVERERLIEACGICPVDALSVVDEKGVRIVP